MSLFKRAMTLSFRLFGELGYDTSIIFLRFKDRENADPVEISHQEYDGVNGFLEILKRHQAFQLEGFPIIPPRPKRNILLRWFHWIHQYFRVIAQFSCQSRQWAFQGRVSPDFILVGTLLEVSETSDIRTLAKKHQVSVNSLLLYALHRSVLPFLQPGQDPSAWIIPVMLYDQAEQAFEKGNLTSIFEVNLKETDSPESIQDQVKKEVQQEAYRGTWLGAIINSFLPDFINRLILKSTVAKKIRVGTLSNLGKWKGASIPGVLGWGAVPPVHPGQPLGAGVIEYNGRMALALKLDPSLGFDEIKTRALMNAWIKKAGDKNEHSTF